MTAPAPETFVHNGVTYIVKRAAPQPGYTVGTALELRKAPGQPTSPFDAKLCAIALRLLGESDRRRFVREAERAAATAKPPTREEAVAPLMRAWSKAQATADEPVDSNVTTWRNDGSALSSADLDRLGSGTRPHGAIVDAYDYKTGQPVQKTAPPPPARKGVSVTTEVRGPLRPVRKPRAPDDTAGPSCEACGANLSPTRVCTACGLKDKS